MLLTKINEIKSFDLINDEDDIFKHKVSLYRHIWGEWNVMKTFRDIKIAIAGTGYVGLSIATLLSQNHKVTAVHIIKEKIDLINNRKSPIKDKEIQEYLTSKKLNLTATLDIKKAYKDADFVIISTPTNYDSEKNFFDTSTVEAVIKQVMAVNSNAIMVIKSTVPVG